MKLPRILRIIASPSIQDELANEIISKQREVIQNEIEQIKMNHRVMCSKAILYYLSGKALEHSSSPASPSQSEQS